jgi:hypothetical protein
MFFRLSKGEAQGDSDTPNGLIGTMELIRVGFFEHFKGANTLLIDVDAEGLRRLIAWLCDVISSRRKVALSDCPGASLQSGLQAEALLGRDDAGLLKTPEGAFV